MIGAPFRINGDHLYYYRLAACQHSTSALRVKGA